MNRIPRLNRSAAWALLVLAGGLLVPACDPQADTHGISRGKPVAPVALAASVAYVDPRSNLAFMINPAQRPLRARPVTVGKRAVTATRRLGQDELLVLSQGVPGQPGIEAEAPSLTAIPADASKPARRYPLSSRFDTVAQAPDGRFAVLHFSRGQRPGEESSLLFNPNEVAVLDLDAPPSAMASSRTLRSFGAVPQAVVFSPPLSLRGEGTQPPRPLKLAVVLSDNTLTLFDLENDRTEITVSLTRADEARIVRPIQVLFDAGDPANRPTEDAQIFVRCEGSNDIVALRLLPAPAPRADRANDFRPVLSLLGAPSRPTDLALIAAADGPRLLVLAPDTSDAAVIDPRTSRVTTFRLDAPGERLVLFDAASPAEPTSRPRALLISGANTQVGFLDLDRIEELRGRNLELRSMTGKVSEFVPLVDRGVVVAHHDPATGTLSVIDLSRRTIAPLVIEPLAQLRAGPAPADELWLVPASRTRVGVLRLAGLTAQELRLDLPVASVLPLGPSAGGNRFVVVDHGSDGGSLTVLDAARPDRATARSLIGFLYVDLLKRP